MVSRSILIHFKFWKCHHSDIDAIKLIDIFNGFLAKYPNNPVFQENLASIYLKKGITIEPAAFVKELKSELSA